jgi:hypothetical protein
MAFILSDRLAFVKHFLIGLSADDDCIGDTNSDFSDNQFLSDYSRSVTECSWRALQILPVFNSFLYEYE